MDGRIVYAIGDVHGCHEHLLAMERKIVADAEGLPGPKLIVMLGDYVDRGSGSGDVLDHLVRDPPPGFERICLAGNHEAAMLDYLDGRIERSSWLGLGGNATLLSYGLDVAYLERIYGPAGADRAIRDAIPDDHVAFLRSLPVMIRSRRFVFVHAGIRPGVSLGAQSDMDLLTIRGEFLASADKPDWWIIHGHTPVLFPTAHRRRLCLDTGVVDTGLLTAVRIMGDRGRLIFQGPVHASEQAATVLAT